MIKAVVEGQFSLPPHLLEVVDGDGGGSSLALQSCSRDLNVALCNVMGVRLELA